MEALEVTHPFRCTGEQIDGGLKYDGENYLIEAKWNDRSASTSPLYTFAHKVDGKMYGRGLFMSVNGFSPDPVRALLKGKALRTVLIDGEDLTLALEGHLTFTKMLDEKIRAAQLKGQIYIHPLRKAPKIDIDH
jgi:restriction endonuclease Mrr